MQNFTVDLYKEFNLPRLGDGGFLHIYKRDDCLSPQTNSTVFPAMLIFPGGGYTHLSPREGEPIALSYLSAGFISAICSYSCNKTYPVALCEAVLSMLYLRNNSDILSINPDKIAVCGFSAGAHLSGCLSFLYSDEKVYEKLSGLFDKKQDLAKLIKPNAVVFCYPVITSEIAKAHAGSFDVLAKDNFELREELSLEKRVDKLSPPAFIWHTYSDETVPVFNSLLLANAYAENKVPFSLHIYEKGKHGLALGNALTNVEASLYKDGKLIISQDLPNWFNLSVNWLTEQGFVFCKK